MAFYFDYTNSSLFLKSTLFRALPVRHGFGTRRGGAAAWAAAGADWAMLRQIHSARVVRVTRSATGTILADSGAPLDDAAPPAGDALVTDVAGITLVVQTADCLPVLLYDPARRVAAAVHSGWRGTAADICGAAVRRMADDWGCDPADIRAAVGPGIQACCYAVGEDVADRFAGRFPGAVTRRTGGKTHLDLRACVAAALRQAGVRPGHTDASVLCTCCWGALFFSYRRQGEGAGRLYHWIRFDG